MVEAHVGEVICGRKAEEGRKQGIGWGNANEDGRMMKKWDRVFEVSCHPALRVADGKNIEVVYSCSLHDKKTTRVENLPVRYTTGMGVKFNLIDDYLFIYPAIEKGSLTCEYEEDDGILCCKSNPDSPLEISPEKEKEYYDFQKRLQKILENRKIY